MNRRLSYILLLSLLLTACISAPPETPPFALLKAEEQMSTGTWAFAENDYVTASTHFQHALADYSALDYVKGMVPAHLNLAETALALHSLKAAQKHLDVVADLIQRERLSDLLPRLNLLQATLAIRQQNYDKALALLETLLLEIEGQHHCPSNLHLSAMSNRTLLAFMYTPQQAATQLRRFEFALLLCLNARPRPQHGTLAAFRGRLERFKAQLALQQHDVQSAHQALNKALLHYRRALYRPGLAATLTEWAKLLMQQQNWSEADNRLERAITIRLHMQDAKGTTQNLALWIQVKKMLKQKQAVKELEKWQALLQEKSDDVWLHLREAKKTKIHTP
ncbi:Tetratricopeptide repeat protein [Candidatus Venteria ishoeyi]|uniref:Tetratricopeptide repeat protein n=1 Tax=Candidatus Venteria ishoeyi TaxID=1899563 RepID=A0A1H6FHW9_9GAMM|nr:Tetratricopeptide repeat protein [Candidatus Venteria ishoeyi]